MPKEKKTEIGEEGYLIFKDSKMPVHRWVAEKKYGKAVVKGKEVHHIDGNKTNNQKYNLILLSKDDHYLLHEFQRKQMQLGKYRMKTWAFGLLVLAVLIQIPFFWVPYVTQFISVFLVLIAILGGIRTDKGHLWEGAEKKVKK